MIPTLSWILMCFAWAMIGGLWGWAAHSNHSRKRTKELYDALWKSHNILPRKTVEQEVLFQDVRKVLKKELP